MSYKLNLFVFPWQAEVNMSLEVFYKWWESAVRGSCKSIVLLWTSSWGTSNCFIILILVDPEYLVLCEHKPIELSCKLCLDIFEIKSHWMSFWVWRSYLDCYDDKYDFCLCPCETTYNHLPIKLKIMSSSSGFWEMGILNNL